jgi:RNA polymerase sigma-70 factor (ECF subfamily)
MGGMSSLMAADPSFEPEFTALYRRTIAPLRRYLARMLGDDGEAEDIAHDAYLRIYRSTQDHPAHKPEALLYTTAKRLAFNRLKRRSIAPILPVEPHPETTASSTRGVAEEVAAKQELQLLEQAIARLPPGCRTVLLLRKVELLSHREISERLGIAISTIEKQHARALRLLRQQLGELSATPANPETPLPNREAKS